VAPTSACRFVTPSRCSNHNNKNQQTLVDEIWKLVLTALKGECAMQIATRQMAKATILDTSGNINLKHSSEARRAL